MNNNAITVVVYVTKRSQGFIYIC